MNNSAFNKEQFDNIYPPGIENHYWNHCRNRIIFDVLKKYSLLQKNILEIGCGRGIVVEYLNTKNLSVEGCELAPLTIEDRLKNIVHSGINALNLPVEKRNNIDVILLLDVIEHIDKPEDFFNEISQAFPNAKHFVVSVPACPGLWSNYDEYNGHFRRYNIDMLSRFAGNVKMKTGLLQYLFHSLYLPAKFLLKRGKQRNTSLKAPKGIACLIHRLISFYFYLDYKIMPGRAKGTSLLVYLLK